MPKKTKRSKAKKETKRTTKRTQRRKSGVTTPLDKIPTLI